MVSICQVVSLKSHRSYVNRVVTFCLLDYIIRHLGSVIVTKFEYLRFAIMAELVTRLLNGTSLNEDESIRLVLEDYFGEDSPTSCGM